MDRDAIVNLINQYALAVDSLSWDLFDQIFTDDVDIDYHRTMLWQDLPSFKSDFADFHAGLESSQHTMVNHQVLVQGDRAFALTYGHWRLVRHVPNSGSNVWEGTAWYDDALIRTDRGWRIGYRRARANFWTGNPFVVVPDPGSAVGAFPMFSFRVEAEEGRIGYLNSLRESVARGE